VERDEGEHSGKERAFQMVRAVSYICRRAKADSRMYSEVSRYPAI